MKDNTILLEIKSGVALITMNKPKTLNALSGETLRELDEAIEIIEADDTVKAVIITGEGKAFIAGADIAYMQKLTPGEAMDFSQNAINTQRKIENSDKVYIAAINGYALGGGCEFAMACDLRIASDMAKFGQPETGLGVIPGFAGTQRLPRLVGLGVSKELIFTGDIIDAKRALAIGLVNNVVKAEELLAAAYALAEKILKKGPIAVGYAKKAINIGIETDLETGIALEKSLFGLCFATYDQTEGMTAFAQKRPPNFRGE